MISEDIPSSHSSSTYYWNDCELDDGHTFNYENLYIDIDDFDVGQFTDFPSPMSDYDGEGSVTDFFGFIDDEEERIHQLEAEDGSDHDEDVCSGIFESRGSSDSFCCCSSYCSKEDNFTPRHQSIPCIDYGSIEPNVEQSPSITMAWDNYDKFREEEERIRLLEAGACGCGALECNERHDDSCYYPSDEE